MKKYCFLALFSLSIGLVSAQERRVLPFDIPSQNALKFNRFLMNPTFSFVEEDYSYINFYHRNQWTAFDDSPRTYFVNYSGKINDNAGVGMGLYQQKLGVFTNFGMIANYSYNVKLNDKSSLTFGFNTVFYSSGINVGETKPGEGGDPSLRNVDEASVFTLHPGLNLTLGSFDIGVYAENLVGYNVKKNEFIGDSSSGNTFSGHLMYTRKFGTGKGLFEDGKLSILTRGRVQEKDDFIFSFGSIFDLPKIGWVQAGYDDHYGMSFGLGFKLSQTLSLGYAYEKGMENSMSNLGVTHEIVFAYSFNPKTKQNEEEKNESNASLERKKKEPLERKKREPIAKKEPLERKKREPIAKKERLERKKKEPIAKKEPLESEVKNTNVGTEKLQSNNEESVEKVLPGGRKPFVLHTSRADEVEEEENNESDFSMDMDQDYSRSGNVERNLEHVKKGYYIIANVYENAENLQYFMQILEEKGIASSTFEDSENQKYYVYLERYDTLKDAMAAYNSNIDNTYDAPIWILHVK